MTTRTIRIIRVVRISNRTPQNTDAWCILIPITNVWAGVFGAMMSHLCWYLLRDCTGKLHAFFLNIKAWPYKWTCNEAELKYLKSYLALDYSTIFFCPEYIHLCIVSLWDLRMSKNKCFWWSKMINRLRTTWINTLPRQNSI